MQQLITSPFDKRSYKLLQLNNKVRCLLISDMEADLAGAAINVHVGSALDPKDSMGIAHFLEHMLF